MDYGCHAECKVKGEAPEATSSLTALARIHASGTRGGRLLGNVQPHGVLLTPVFGSSRTVLAEEVELLAR